MELIVFGPCLTCGQLDVLDPGSGRCPICPWEPAVVRAARRHQATDATWRLALEALGLVALLVLVVGEVGLFHTLLFSGD